MALVVIGIALVAIAVGRPIDRDFFYGLATIIGAFAVLALLAPFFGKIQALEDRLFWHRFERFVDRRFGRDDERR